MLHSYDMHESLLMDGFLSEAVVVDTKETGEHILERFQASPELEGIVVLEASIPVGLIMRTYFFQKLGSEYGHALYSKRPISILMDTEITCVAHDESIETVSRIASSRGQNKLYDFILVTQATQFVGIISIREFLITLSKRNQEQVIKLKAQNEKESKLRTSLQEKTHAIHNLLNHAGQGFLSFGEDFIINAEYSMECTNIFQCEIGDQNYLELIAPFFSEEKCKVLSSILHRYFQSANPQVEGSYLSLLPSEVSIHEKKISMVYKSIHDGTSKHVMVVLTDITDKKQMEQALEQEAEVQRLIVKVIQFKSDICQLIHDFEEECENQFRISEYPGEPREYLLELFRLIHTFKGDFAQYGFRNTMRALHEIENQLQELLDAPQITGPDIEHTVQNLQAMDVLRQDIELVEGFLGDGYFEESKLITITEDRFQSVLWELCEYVPRESKRSIEKVYQTLSYRSIKESLLAYQDYICYLSGRLEKTNPKFLISGDTIYIDSIKFGPLLKNLVHIFRNSVDHGLETEEERLLLDKDPIGTIQCHVIGNQSSFTLEISDDGRGIAVDSLSEKALKKGLCTQTELNALTDHERLHLVFLDQLSSKELVNQVSGRGMGLSSLKKECLSLGGNIQVRSKQNAGTTFTITLPY